MALALKLPDWTRWLRIARAEQAHATLSRRHVYILPTRAGWFFALLLLLMLIGSINYTLSLGFVLVFLLTGMSVVGMLHTWRNLAHLQATAGRIEPVFAGDNAMLRSSPNSTRRRRAHKSKSASTSRPTVPPLPGLPSPVAVAAGSMPVASNCTPSFHWACSTPGAMSILAAAA
jgi:hypothetical protein